MHPEIDLHVMQEIGAIARSNILATESLSREMDELLAILRSATADIAPN